MRVRAHGDCDKLKLSMPCAVPYEIPHPCPSLAFPSHLSPPPPPSSLLLTLESSKPLKIESAAKVATCPPCNIPLFLKILIAWLVQGMWEPSKTPCTPMSASMVAVTPSISLWVAHGKTRSAGTLKTFSGSLYLA